VCGGEGRRGGGCGGGGVVGGPAAGLIEQEVDGQWAGAAGKGGEEVGVEGIGPEAGCRIGGGFVVGGREGVIVRVGAGGGEGGEQAGDGGGPAMAGDGGGGGGPAADEGVIDTGEGAKAGVAGEHGCGARGGQGGEGGVNIAGEVDGGECGAGGGGECEAAAE